MPKEFQSIRLFVYTDTSRGRSHYVYTLELSILEVHSLFQRAIEPTSQPTVFV